MTPIFHTEREYSDIQHMSASPLNISTRRTKSSCTTTPIPNLRATENQFSRNSRSAYEWFNWIHYNAISQQTPRLVFGDAKRIE